MAGASKRFWVLGAILVAVNVGGWAWVRYGQEPRRDGRIRVLSALPTQDIDATDRFVLIFDESLPLRGPLNAALDRAPFTIRPGVSGEWQWAAADRLEFVLHSPLPPSRRFTISPTPELEQQLGRALVGPAEFHFATRPPEVLACDFHSTDGQHANIELRFNQPIDPDTLLKNIACADAESLRPLTATTLTTEPTPQILLRTQRPQSGRVKLDLGAALTGVGGDVPMPAPWSGFVAVSPRFALLRSWVYTPSLDDTVAVELNFSHDLDRHAALPKIEFSPPVANVQARYSYGSELRIEGRFECGRRYTVTVGADLRSSTGEALGEPQSLAFDVPNRSPGLRFPHSIGRLIPGGNLTLDLEAVNVATVELRSARIHPNNLAAHLRGDEVKATARALPDRKVRIDAPPNQPQQFAVDLSGLLTQPLGIYQIEADATDQNWTRDTAVVCVTDLGLTSKRECDGLLVWVTSLRTAQPAVGVEVVALSYNNQTLATAVTADDGVARLAIPADHPDGEPWLITARQGEDLSFLIPERGAWLIDDIDQGGHKLAGKYDVLLYTERGAYRPGDTVRLTGVIRDADGNIPPAFPLTIRVTRPDGRRVAELPIRIAETAADAAPPASPDPFDGRVGPQGLFQVSYETSSDAQTGRYRFTATLPGAETTLGEVATLVEAFVPVRIEVTAKTQPHVNHEDEFQVRVAARYLFGQPAAALPVKLAGELRAALYKSERYPDFTFGDPTRDERQYMKEAEALLDDQGLAVLDCRGPDVIAARSARAERDDLESWNSASAPVRWSARLVATVTEPGGRSISSEMSTVIDGVPTFLGLKLPGGAAVPAGQPLTVQGIRVRPDDTPAPHGTVELRLVRVEHDNTLEQVNGRPVWKSHERIVVVASHELTEHGESEIAPVFEYEFDAPTPGRYRLQARDLDTGALTQLEFDSVSVGDSAQSVPLDLPERLELILDRSSYTPGGSASLTVRSPFAGTLFVTLESDRVLEHRVVTMTENTTTVELPLSARLRGGAFVSALVVRPIDPRRETWLPHRALGLARLQTDHSAAELPIEITAPAKSQPGDTAHIVVQTAPPSDADTPTVVHLWAVDEGILLTTAYPTPHPLHHFLAPRAACVTTADAFGDLLPDHARPADLTRIGAGDDGEGADWDDAEARRRGPVSAPARAPTVIWRAATLAGPDGRAEFETSIPDFTGELRFMAVAVAGDRYGSAQHPTTVTAPLLAEMTWPRAAAPGDQFDAPVKLFNSTAEALDVTLSLKIDGPLTLETPADSVVRVEPGTPATLWLHATAAALGPVRIELQATAASRADVHPATNIATLVIRPAAPLHTEAQLVPVDAGASRELSLTTPFVPGSARTLVSISRRPSVELRPALQKLLDYPYGCVEQTTSRLFVLLHAPELLGSTSAPSASATTVDAAPREAAPPAAALAARDMVQAGIVRLWSMQTRSGGLSYWPGDAQPYLWGSANAGLFLAQARKSGYEIDPRFTKELSDYLQSALDRVDQDEPLDDDTRALLCAVLAAFDRAPLGWMTRLGEHPDTLDSAGRAHLAAAWLAAGRRERAVAALPEDVPTAATVTTTGGRLTSAVHQDAALLEVLLDLDPAHGWIPALVQRLEAARKDGTWGSTLENAAAFAALARYQSLLTDDAEFEGVLETARGGRYSFASSETSNHWLDAADLPATLRTAGRGRAYASLTAEGLLPGENSQPYDRRLSVRRAWTDAAGDPLDPARLRVGDLIYVDIALSCADLDEEATVDNVAIVDLLPGGCEVENPRLATSAGAAENSSADRPDRVEFLDDRVVLFTSVGKSERHFRYLVRAVTAGAFVHAPIQAACMYDAAYASMHGGGRVEIGR